MRIRTVTPLDRAEWLRMRVAIWPDGSAEEHAAEIDAILADPAGTIPPLAAVFVCEAAPGRLSGFLELSVRDYAEGCMGPTPYVEGWYVDAGSRGAGVGAALMAAAEAWARDHGFRELASDTEIDNTGSQRAHRALGFDEVERLVVFRKAL